MPVTVGSFQEKDEGSDFVFQLTGCCVEIKDNISRLIQFVIIPLTIPSWVIMMVLHYFISQGEEYRLKLIS